METIALVLPDDGGPKISVIAPRGRPPVRESSAAIPVGTLSKTRRSRSVARRTTDCIKVIEDQFSYTEHLYGMSMDHSNAQTRTDRRTVNSSKANDIEA